MSNTVRNIAIAVVSGFLTFGGIEIFSLVKAAKSLGVAPGKIKLGVPVTRVVLENNEKKTLLPLEATILLTNNTSKPLTFQHPTANVFYQNRNIAVSEASNRSHTLGANAKDYALVMNFEVDINSFAQSLKDAAVYFMQRFSGKQTADRQINVALDINAYGMDFHETIPFKI